MARLPAPSGGAVRAAEIHVASCVVRARPDRLAEVARAIADAGHAEVPLPGAEGRLVILIERTDAGGVLEAMESVRALPGVVSVNLAYQHCEGADSSQEQP